MRKLIIYPNLSRGGITSVIRGRAAAEPDTIFDVIFLQERGGRGVFDDLDNVEVRICSESRIENFLKYWLYQVEYEEISVLSHPRIANIITSVPETVVTYEFHSSDMKIIDTEIKELNLEPIAQFTAPSSAMVEQISAVLPRKYHLRMRKMSNLIDSNIFFPNGLADFFHDSSSNQSEQIPLVWIGRFDEGKGYRYFLRLLAKLPVHYFGAVVVSLEEDPQRPSQFLAEASALGVLNRVKIYSNLSRVSVAELYRSVRDLNGWLVSTSLMESFGYSVAEAISCDLRVAAFELPAFHEFLPSNLLNMSDVGSVTDLATLILREQ